MIYYKRIVVIILLFAQLFFVNILKGESKFREEKNIQLQILIGGGLIGYHFNDQIFIGFQLYQIWYKKMEQWITPLKLNLD